MNRSSKVSTGTSSTARSASTNRSGLQRLRAALAAQRQREPDDDALGLLLPDEPASRASPASVAARSTTVSGRASIPVGSETATPVRAAP